jgi:hypothetical protein
MRETMKLTRLIITLTVISLTASAVSAQFARGREMKLREARALWVGKTVKLKPAHLIYGMLSGWYRVVKDGDVYVTETGLDKYLPSTYQNGEAQVVALQVNHTEGVGNGKPNALGEILDDNDLVNPYTDVIIRFDDGTLAMTTSYLSLFTDPGTTTFVLASEKRDRMDAINKELPSILNKVVYAVAYSKLYLPTTTLEELIDETSGAPKRAIDFTKLEPLTIVAAKYNEENDVIILKLRDGKGKEYLTASNFSQTEVKNSFFAKVVSSLPAALLTDLGGLTPRDIVEIKQGSLSRGMSLHALYCLMGFPEKENDYGRGMKQLVYYGGRIFVYLDADSRVNNWQSIDR